MNLNKALWEKGDFTKVAALMRESGEAVVKSLGVTPPLRALAEHVFFSRGSFPDVEPWRTAVGSRLSALGPTRP